MSAARLDLDWKTWTGSVGNGLTATVEQISYLARPIGPARGPKRCPGCHSIIYSRRHKLCGVCSQPLPGELLFTAAEAAQVEHLLRSEQARHRKWIKER